MYKNGSLFPLAIASRVDHQLDRFLLFFFYCVFNCQENEVRLGQVNEELYASLILAKIPWNKLQVFQFKAFLEKYTG